MSLKRVLDWYHILALGVAGIVGTSWVYLNTTFYDLYGPGGVILGYIVATVMASLMALAYSEMGSAINREGAKSRSCTPRWGQRARSSWRGCSSWGCSPRLSRSM